MDRKKIFQVVNEVFSGMEESGVLAEHIDLDEKMVLIGPDAILDSIAFVTLFTDLEDRLSEETGEEIYLLVDEIHAFNPEDTFLTIKVLIDYMEKLLQDK